MAVAKKVTPKTGATAQVMDVKKASASATSRPIIVSSRPIMQDPMMVNSAAATAPELPSSPTHRIKKIEPLSKDIGNKPAEEPAKPKTATGDVATPSAPALTIDAAIAKIAEKRNKPAESNPEPKAEAEAKDDKATEKAAEEPEKKAEKEAPAEPTEEPEQPEPKTETVDDETEGATEDNEGNEDKKSGKSDQQITEEEAAKLAKAAEEEAKRKAQLDKLVEEKAYFLPINQVERRRTLHFSIAGILLIILLGLAWIDLAADAGLITLPVKPVTHFFHAK
jgi:hypothetical protein